MRTLVIQLGRLGDVIQTTPLLMELAEPGSQNEIDLLVVRPNQEGVRELPGLSIIHTVGEDLKPLDDRIAEGFERRAIPPEAFEMLRELRLPRYDRVINASHAPLGCWIAGHIPSELTEGGVIDDRGECLYHGPAHAYRVALLAFREQNWFNVVDLLRSATKRRIMSKPRPRLYVNTSRALPFALPPGRKVALNVGASERHRCWPPTHFARLAEYLNARGMVPILVGAPSDRDLSGEVQAACNLPLPSFMETSIPEMARMLSQVDLLVSVDTGAVHIASAAGTKVLSLSGSTVYFAETAPWGEGHLVLQTPVGSSLSGLAPELVLAAALNRLGLLEEASLRSELIRRGQLGWETCFLPEGADPLGGLSYRPVHADLVWIEDLFTRALRHVFAWEFCRGEGSLSLDYALDLFKHTAVLDLVQQTNDLLEKMNRVVPVLEEMGAAATNCQELNRRSDRQASAEINKIVPQLMTGLEALMTFTAKAEAVMFKPVVQYLDWRLRMMPDLSPEETFGCHAREYRNAAGMLCRAGLLLSELFEAKHA
jgi:ADP-heptose:LPS heptosyltransferase